MVRVVCAGACAAAAVWWLLSQPKAQLHLSTSLTGMLGRAWCESLHPSGAMTARPAKGSAESVYQPHRYSMPGFSTSDLLQRRVILTSPDFAASKPPTKCCLGVLLPFYCCGVRAYLVSCSAHADLARNCPLLFTRQCVHKMSHFTSDSN